MVEADEYAGNFDPYRPDVAVLLNAEWDHPDVFADEAAVLDAFEGWLRRAGRRAPDLVANVGDAGVRDSLDRLRRLAGPRGPGGARRRTARSTGGRGCASAVAPAGWSGRRATPDRGRGRRGAGMRLGLAGPTQRRQRPVRRRRGGRPGHPAAGHRARPGQLPGVGRRMEVKGEPRGVLVLDDYGHHPTAIAATLSAVRERIPRPAGLGGLRAADVPPYGGHADAVRRRAGDGGPGRHRGHLGRARPGHDHHQRRERWRRPSARRAAMPAVAPGSVEETAAIPRRARCARATWCWSWVAAGRTSSPTCWWRPSAPRESALLDW